MPHIKHVLFQNDTLAEWRSSCTSESSISLGTRITELHCSFNRNLTLTVQIVLALVTLVMCVAIHELGHVFASLRVELW